MKHFFKHDQDGRIVMSGAVQDFDLQLQHEDGDGLTLVEGTADFTSQYFDIAADAIKPIPPQPSPSHTFDWKTKKWADKRFVAELRLKKWQEIKAARGHEEFGPFTFDGSVFNGDVVSQGRIRGKALRAMQQPDLTVEFTLFDNSTRTLSADQIVGLNAALDEHIDALHAKARALRAQLAKATKSQLTSIIW